MTIVQGGSSALDYKYCTYDGSRVRFRGPRRDLDQPYVAFLGGDETLGRFVAMPFPDRVEDRVGMACVNLGATHAGPDFYLSEQPVLDVVARARAVVIQVPDAALVSNRYYAVHPRRNDRFLHASDALQALYPEVDFTEFHFIRHMLGRLSEVSATRFATLAAELRGVWLARMRQLIACATGPVLLLWLSRRGPATDAALPDIACLVTDGMVQDLARDTAGLVVFRASPDALEDGTLGMHFCPQEAGAAAGLPGPAVHAEAARAILPALRRLLPAAV